MTQTILFRTSIVVTGLLFAATQPVSAMYPFGTYCKKKCPPLCSPFFGYQPTQWRPWPTVCGDVPAQEHAEAPSLPKPQPSPEIKDKKEDETTPAKKEAAPAPPVPKPEALPPIPEKKPEESRAYPPAPSIFAVPSSRH